MGIKNIKKFLERNCPDALITLSVTSMRGRLAAVDANSWIYLITPGPYRKALDEMDLHEGVDETLIQTYLVDELMRQLLFWTNYGILPVFVFDGEAPRVKREIQRTRRKREIAPAKEMDQLLKELRKDPFPLPGDQRVKRFRKLFLDNPRSYRYIPFIKEVLFALGLPVIQCTTEAEKLCSMLSVQTSLASQTPLVPSESSLPLVDFVLSEDTDNTVYGCPLLVSPKKTFISQEVQFQCVRTDRIYSGLHLTRQEFVDLCIMIGCDYNGGRGVFRVRRNKLLELLQHYKRIDRVMRHLDLDDEPLNWPESREAFRSEWCQDLVWWEKQPLRVGQERDVECLLRPCLDTLQDRGRRLLEEYDVDGWDVLLDNLHSWTRKSKPMKYFHYQRLIFPDV